MKLEGMASMCSPLTEGMPCTSSYESEGHAHNLYKGPHLGGHFFLLI